MNFTRCFKRSLILFLITLHLPTLSAENPDKFELKMTGRLFIDGGFYLNSPSELTNKTHLSELRLGTKLRYQNWYSKVDIGLSSSKVGLKDAYVEYNHNNSYIRGGYMLGFFSLDQCVSTNDYIFHTGAPIAETFYPGRRTGISYTYATPVAYASAGAFLGNKLITDAQTEAGHNYSARAVWRPHHTIGDIIHIGAGFLYKVPDKNLETGLRPFELANKGGTYIPSPPLNLIEFEDVKYQTQANIECLIQHQRWFVQAEYLWMNIQQEAMKNSYLAQGGYIHGGYLLRGTTYGYDMLDALAVNPVSPNSILLACRFNYTNLNSDKTNQYGGDQKDITIGINYYFNRYLSSRLNYSRLWLGENSLFGKCQVNQIQLRLQAQF
jgi:phosphate-selective porin OprO/OprP